MSFTRWLLVFESSKNQGLNLHTINQLFYNFFPDQTLPHYNTWYAHVIFHDIFGPSVAAVSVLVTQLFQVNHEVIAHSDCNLRELNPPFWFEVNIWNVWVLDTQMLETMNRCILSIFLYSYIYLLYVCDCIICIKLMIWIITRYLPNLSYIYTQ